MGAVGLKYIQHNVHWLPILCGSMAVAAEALFLSAVLLLLPVPQGDKLALSSLGACLLSAAVVAGTGVWVIRSADHAQAMQLLEETLVARLQLEREQASGHGTVTSSAHDTSPAHSHHAAAHHAAAHHAAGHHEGAVHLPRLEEHRLHRAASLQISQGLKRFRVRAMSQRFLEFQQWYQSSERRVIEYAVETMLVVAAVMLVRPSRSR